MRHAIATLVSARRAWLLWVCRPKPRSVMVASSRIGRIGDGIVGLGVLEGGKYLLAVIVKAASRRCKATKLGSIETSTSPAYRSGAITATSLYSSRKKFSPHLQNAAIFMVTY